MGQINKETLAKHLNNYRKIFFFRACGTGMGAAACLLKDYGLEVEGADHMFYPPMSSYLKRIGIPCYQIKSLKQDDYKKFDLIVVGNVVPKKSADAQMLESLDIPFCSFSAAVGAFVLQDREVIGIAGTHGKTTTAYFAVQVFEKLGMSPGYLIGGAIDERPSASIGSDKYFFIESDEYDSVYFEKFSKFHNYFIDQLIITSLEFDHADIFQSVDDIEKEFGKLLKTPIKKTVLCHDYPSIKNLDLKSVKYQYSYGRNTKIGPYILKESSHETVFRVNFNQISYDFVTNILGLHNIDNLTSVIILALSEGFSYKDLASAVKELKFVKRRQEYRGLYKEAVIIDDFAHHPRSVKATIDAIKIRFPRKNIHVVMEFASATARSHIFQKDFEQSLQGANSVALVENGKATSVSWADNIDKAALVKKLKKQSWPSYLVNNLCDLKEFIENYADRNSVILILSNSSCLGLWESDFVKDLY